MTKPKNILVPTDFSDASNAARDYATILAEAFGSTLHLLHVIPEPMAMGWAVDAGYLPQLMERTEQTVREQLEKAVTAEHRARFKVQFAVATGSAVSEIVDYAQKQQIDLIVMGTQGRGAIERVWVGSVTQGVLGKASCPVVSMHQPRH